MNELEASVQRKLTSAFIAADPKQVTLIRSSRVPNGSGGFKNGPPLLLPPQEARLIPLGYKTAERDTGDGVKVTPELVLLLNYDGDVQRDDTFEDSGLTYRVVWVNQKRDYEVKAEVVTVRGGQ